MAKTLLLQNLNVLWASLIVDQLVKNSITKFYISPGNRNAPLLSALANNSDAEKSLCIDERGAGYRALGYAKGTGKPAVLLCTSGTALSNYFPSVIEAFRDELPVIIISADRPPELTGSDANQTIDQTGFFGKYTAAHLNLPAPAEEFSLKALLTKLNNLISNCSGPVHINCRFRDPLVPVESERQISEDYLNEAKSLFNMEMQYAKYSKSILTADKISTDKTREIIKNTKKGLLIIGRIHPYEKKEAIIKLIESINWPVYCDIGSSLKHMIPSELLIFDLDHPESIRLINEYSPDTVLHLGNGLVSRHFYESIISRSNAEYIMVNRSSLLQDPSHRVNIKIISEYDLFTKTLDIDKEITDKNNKKKKLINSFNLLEEELEKNTPKNILSNYKIAEVLVKNIDAHCGLFLGNSITIREFNRQKFQGNRDISIIANRGVSGIEGNIATSVGFSEATGMPVTIVLGDISFLHDMTSLTYLNDTDARLIIVVINNRGGRIFERLPVSGFPEILNPYATTPHNMNFRCIADQFEIPYYCTSTATELKDFYKKAQEEITLQKTRHSFIEITLSSKDDLKIFKKRNSVTI